MLCSEEDIASFGNYGNAVFGRNSVFFVGEFW